MWTTKFDPNRRVIEVNVRLFGPAGSEDFELILDTGTPVTIIDPSIADRLGYSPLMGRRTSRLWSTGGPQSGYVLEIARLEAMGFAVECLEVGCHDFPEGLGVEGLVGMDLLAGHIVTLDLCSGQLTVGP